MVVKAQVKPTAEQIQQRYKDNAPNDDWYQITDADKANLNTIVEKYKTVDAISKFGTTKIIAWGKSTLQLKKDIAAIIVALRMKHISPKGNFPDWRGSSGAYQMAKGNMMRASGLSPQDLAGIDSSIRYHVQNLVVAIAPKKELEAVEMLTTSRRARQAQKSATPPVTPPAPTPPTTTPEPSTPVSVGGVEAPPQEKKGNNAEYLMLYVRDCLKRVYESPDLLKADTVKILDLIKETQHLLVQIGDKKAEAVAASNRKRAAAKKKTADAAAATTEEEEAA